MKLILLFLPLLLLSCSHTKRNKNVRNAASEHSNFLHSSQCHSGYPLSDLAGDPVESHIIESHLDAGNKELIRQQTFKRKHDLYRPMTGTLIFPETDSFIHSIFSGEIIKGPYLFQDGKFAIDILTDNNLVVRYALLDIINKNLKVDTKWYKKIKNRTRINRGDIIGATKGSYGNFKRGFLIEIFDRSAKGPLTNLNSPLKRRKDLIRSFPYIKSLSGCL